MMTGSPSTSETAGRGFNFGGFTSPAPFATHGMRRVCHHVAVATESAGIVVWRWATEPEVLLVHPGGPFWLGKDRHAWSIPKGEFDPANESALDAAKREFAEELGQPAPDLPYVSLGITRAGKKRIHAWIAELTDETLLATDRVISNEFELEWPPRSGRFEMFPEVDVAEWVGLESLESKLHKGHAPLIPVIVAEIVGGADAR